MRCLQRRAREISIGGGGWALVELLILLEPAFGPIVDARDAGLRLRLVEGSRIPTREAGLTPMSIYDPLSAFLKQQRLNELILDFPEIEKLIGRLLPASAERPQWWANEKNPSTSHTQRNAWRDAGYDAFLIKGSNKVRFVRVSRKAGI